MLRARLCVTALGGWLLAAPLGGQQPPASTDDRPALHILAVGVDRYGLSSLGLADLQAAAHDARRFSAALENAAAGLYRVRRPTLLLDAAATREGVNAAIREVVDRSAPEDLFVFYFAGHGNPTDGDEAALFLPAAGAESGETLQSVLSRSAITPRLLRAWLDVLPARRHLVVIDAVGGAEFFGEFLTADALRAEEDQDVGAPAVAAIACSGVCSFERRGPDGAMEGVFTSLVLGALEREFLDTPIATVNGVASRLTAHPPLADAVLRQPGPTLEELRPVFYLRGSDFPIAGSAPAAVPALSHLRRSLWLWGRVGTDELDQPVFRRGERIGGGGPGMQDLYTLEGRAGERLTVEILSTEPGLLAELEGPEGALLDQDTLGGTEAGAYGSHLYLQAELPETGAYALRVRTRPAVSEKPSLEEAHPTYQIHLGWGAPAPVAARPASTAARSEDPGRERAETIAERLRRMEEEERRSRLSSLVSAERLREIMRERAEREAQVLRERRVVLDDASPLYRLAGRAGDPEQLDSLHVLGQTLRADSAGRWAAHIDAELAPAGVPVVAFYRDGRTLTDTLRLSLDRGFPGGEGTARSVATAPARQGKDIALLFAVNEYEHWKDLRNPIADARAVAEELERNYGFEVHLVENPTRRVIQDSLLHYARASYGPEDQLLIFIAGHGAYDTLYLQDGYVAGADARSPAEDPYKDDVVQYNWIRRLLERSASPHVLLLLDVCYGGSFDRRASEADYRSDSGEDPLYAEADLSTFIRRKLEVASRRYLTSGGLERVPDGRPGEHSPFARRLLEALRTYGGPNGDGVLTLAELVSYMERLEPEPRAGPFPGDEPGGDFLFIAGAPGREN